jgi:hypothetical protein
MKKNPVSWWKSNKKKQSHDIIKIKKNQSHGTHQTKNQSYAINQDKKKPNLIVGINKTPNLMVGINKNHSHGRNK